MSNLSLALSSMCMSVDSGRNKGTCRGPNQTQGELVNFTQKGHDPHAVRPQGKPSPVPFIELISIKFKWSLNSFFWSKSNSGHFLIPLNAYLVHFCRQSVLPSRHTSKRWKRDRLECVKVKHGFQVFSCPMHSAYAGQFKKKKKNTIAKSRTSSIWVYLPPLPRFIDHSSCPPHIFHTPLRMANPAAHSCPHSVWWSAVASGP